MWRQPARPVFFHFDGNARTEGPAIGVSLPPPGPAPSPVPGARGDEPEPRCGHL